MRKLRIGIWLSDDLTPESGGVYGYYTNLVNSLNQYPFKNAGIIFLSDKKIKSNDFDNKIINWRPRRRVTKIILNGLKKMNPIFKGLRKKIEETNHKHAQKLKNELYQYADVIYYPAQNCIYPDFPYIYTLWDLGHITSYAFPELSMNEIFEKRKNHNDSFPRKALMVFAESETGKKDCEQYLNINKNRIKVVPIFSSEITDSKCVATKPTKIEEGDFFIHYPAQYWAHKNHYNLLLAMLSVIKTFPKIKLVLTGSDKGNKEHVLKTINELGLKENIMDLDFVSLKELRWLYENSQGLVMPTLLGPVNMPLLEAAELGCPVACTNLSGHIEQLGDYGYYFNGLDPDDIAKQIILMINDKKNGITKKYNNRFNISNAMKAIDEAFGELKQIRFCWGK